MSSFILPFKFINFCDCKEHQSIMDRMFHSINFQQIIHHLQRLTPKTEAFFKKVDSLMCSWCIYSSAISVCILEGSLDDYAIGPQGITNKGSINILFWGRQWKIIVVRAQHFSDVFFPLSLAVQILYGLTSHFDFFSTTVYVSLTKNKSPEEAILKVAWMCFNQQIQCNQQAPILKVEGLF